jgi:branched-subunit amino acid transport protein AzlD
MSKATFLEFIIRGIPEGFLFVLAVYTFSKTYINVKKYLFSSILFAVIVYTIRQLPIQPGAVTILNLIVLICLMVFINKVDILKAIRAGIIIMIIGFICEGVNVVIIQFLLGKEQLNIVFSNPTLKVLYGIPSVLIFGCIIVIFYLKLLKEKR